MVPVLLMDSVSFPVDFRFEVAVVVDELLVDIVVD